MLHLFGVQIPGLLDSVSSWLGFVQLALLIAMCTWSLLTDSRMSTNHLLIHYVLLNGVLFAPVPLAVLLALVSWTMLCVSKYAGFRDQVLDSDRPCGFRFVHIRR